jgi:hypothetical protein
MKVLIHRIKVTIIFIVILGNQIIMTIKTTICIRNIGKSGSQWSELSSTLSHLTFRTGLINKKYRRYVNDNAHHQHQKPVVRRAHPASYSSSQLSIEVSELHAGSNGRLEITCLSTIPASVLPGEQYADYKTFSVKGETKCPRTMTPSYANVNALRCSTEVLSRTANSLSDKLFLAL